MSVPPRLPLLVEPVWLRAHLDDPDLFVLDPTVIIERDRVNGDRVIPARAAFESGHVPGAQFVDIRRDLSDPHQSLWFMVPHAGEFARAIERIGIGDASRIVIYSTSNVWWATRVWWLLRAFGFDNVAILNGGWSGWTREDHPVETGMGRARPRGAITPRPPRRLTAGKADVLHAIGNPAACIVNALARESHTGAVPSNYGRPGHIKGSVNVPGIEMLDAETNRFLPNEAIERQLADAGALSKETVIAYCGGGITATATAFAMALLGRPDPLIYDASLQEWAPDASLPMELGP